MELYFIYYIQYESETVLGRTAEVDSYVHNLRKHTKVTKFCVDCHLTTQIKQKTKV